MSSPDVFPPIMDFLHEGEIVEKARRLIVSRLDAFDLSEMARKVEAKDAAFIPSWLVLDLVSEAIYRDHRKVYDQLKRAAE